MNFKYSTLRENILASFLLLHYFFVKFFTHKALLVSVMANQKKGKVAHNNWGDDLNIYLIELLTNKKVFICPNCFLTRKLLPRRYMVIGSILTFYPLDNVIVLGSGILNSNMIKNISGNPWDVKFVRGPLTRDVLLSKGIKCPAIYGDPAMILPLVYHPHGNKKKYRIGVIPHYIDTNLPIIEDIMGKYCDDVVIIKMKGYGNWTDIIDSICSCEVGISSSLHGVIVSEAYNIPSYWVYFQDYVDGWSFKFYDFYMSIGKKEVCPIKITKAGQVDDLYNGRREMQSISAGLVDKMQIKNLLLETLKK